MAACIGKNGYSKELLSLLSDMKVVVMQLTDDCTSFFLATLTTTVSARLKCWKLDKSWTLQPKQRLLAPLPWMVQGVVEKITVASALEACQPVTVVRS